MGVDYLDLVFRLEKSFDVKITREDDQRFFTQFIAPRQPADFTAGELHAFIRDLLIR